MIEWQILIRLVVKVTMLPTTIPFFSFVLIIMYTKWNMQKWIAILCNYYLMGFFYSHRIDWSIFRKVVIVSQARNSCLHIKFHMYAAMQVLLLNVLYIICIVFQMICTANISQSWLTLSKIQSSVYQNLPAMLVFLTQVWKPFGIFEPVPNMSMKSLRYVEFLSHVSSNAA